MAIKTKPAAGAFPGFRDEAFSFLKKLAKNNDRDWFLPRKTIFEKELQEPMTQLILALEGEMKKKNCRFKRSRKQSCHASIAMFASAPIKAPTTPS